MKKETVIKSENIATIWTMGYFPFTMGGNVNRPISTEVKIIETKKLKGINFFSFKTPKGTLKVCEAKTGGIIADDFEDLKANIKGCSQTFLQKQIKDAKPEYIKYMTNEEFFSMYKY